MPKKIKSNKHTSVDIFQLLSETVAKKEEKRRMELLTLLRLTEFFVEGNITINKRTCRGIECKLCIKACPTNALFWKEGEVGIVKELCIYCGACVLSCIVDDCIKVQRKRADSKVERFSKPEDFTLLQHRINAKKRFDRVEEARDLLPKPEDYIKRRKPKVTKK